MDNDFDEFFEIVGKDIPTYRTCQVCEEIYVVNPVSFDRPKTNCDPDPDFCARYVPICLCKDGLVLYEDTVEECTYPNCRCGNGE